MGNDDLVDTISDDLVRRMKKWLEEDYLGRYKALLDLVESKDAASDLALQADRTGIAEKVSSMIREAVQDGRIEKVILNVLDRHASNIAAAYLGLEKDAWSRSSITIRNESIKTEINARGHQAAQQWMDETVVLDMESVFTASELRTLRKDIKTRFVYSVRNKLQNETREQAAACAARLISDVAEEVFLEIKNG